MKIQAFGLCGLFLVLPAFGEGGKEQNQHQKRFGDGTCLPKYLDHYDVDRDGVINTEEKQAMEQARDQIRKQLSKDWDDNGDGKLCDKEKEQARTRLRAMIEQTRLVRFNEADDPENGGDGDGALSYDEFSALPGMANKLNDDDPDNDSIVQTIFDRLDADDDGLITVEEFMAAVRQCDRARDGSGDGSGGGGTGGGGTGGGGSGGGGSGGGGTGGGGTGGGGTGGGS